MACNENIIKNIANEVTRDCQGKNVIVDPEFVVYFIDLMLLNPKYGMLFTKTINRTNLQYFVEECVKILIRGDSSLNTLKIQFILQTNYDKLQNLVDKHLESINKCLRPLVNEILEGDPEPNDEDEFKKIFRKISIYVILCSGLGNPGVITTLKEGMAALESVLSMEDLKVFVALPRAEKLLQLNELLEVVSGVRLFNRDCKKGGEGIPDLPFNLVDAGKACLTSLSNSLITVMQRVNTLTTAVEDSIIIQDETGNVLVDVTPDAVSIIDDYKQVFDLLSFNRQYEVFIRKLLSDVETMTHKGTQYVEKAKIILEELHAAVKYKSAVPVVAVFPLFSKLWQVWRAMQNVMYLVSTVNRIMSMLAAIQDQTKIPRTVIDKMLNGKHIVCDQERMNSRVSMEERLSLGSLKNYVAYNENLTAVSEKHVQYLGFCALCLTVGALVPSNMKLGLIKVKGNRYGFCSVKMAARFSRDPHRYVNEVLDYARNNPHVINLLNIVEDVIRVKDIENLIIKHVAKIQICDKDIQTDVHPVDSYIEKNYTWDLWEWKRRACQWATIVNCRTHSTQTDYSHLRSEIQCQTVEPRDKCLQTMKESGMNTIADNYFLWGLRGQSGYGQHLMHLKEPHSPEKKKDVGLNICTWSCNGIKAPSVCSTVSSDDTDRRHTFHIQNVTTE